MKVISLLEPWASLVKKKIKKIETRSWKTNYRGELYIHASKRELTKKQLIEYDKLVKILGNNDFKYGYIIAKCKLVDCIYMDRKYIENVKKNRIEYDCGIYDVSRYAWILEDIEELDIPICVKGQLGIWEYDGELKE